MIESSLYLIASRLDIMFSVCLCARFQSCPKESHMLAVKRIFRYLIDTINLSLWYPRGTHINLTCYSDADFAEYKVDRKSTSGTCHFLGHSLVSWFKVRNKTRLRFQPPRQNILPQVVVVHKFFINETNP